MNTRVEFVVRALLIGTGATLVMDAWTLALKHSLGVSSLSYALLGRWVGHFRNGHFSHQNIAQSVPIRGELIIGWISHYFVGISFATLLVAFWGLDWARHPTPVPPLLVGVCTVVAPFFIMQQVWASESRLRRQRAPRSLVSGAFSRM